jgi:hypothetical protein
MGKSSSPPPPAKIQPATKPFRDLIRPRTSMPLKRRTRNMNDTMSIGELTVFHSRDIQQCPGDIEKSAKASDPPLPRPRLVSFESAETIKAPLAPFASTRTDTWKRIAMKPRSRLAYVCHSLVGVNLLQDLETEACSFKSLQLCSATVQKSEENGFMTPNKGLLDQDYPSLSPRESKSSSEEDCLLWLPQSLPPRLLLPDDF